MWALCINFEYLKYWTKLANLGAGSMPHPPAIVLALVPRMLPTLPSTMAACEVPASNFLPGLQQGPKLGVSGLVMPQHRDG